jgi:hypothetical protein
MLRFERTFDKTALFGKRFTDSARRTWELVAQNDLCVPYFVKVIRGRAQKTKYTLANAEAVIARVERKAKPKGIAGMQAAEWIDESTGKIAARGFAREQAATNGA